MRNYETDLPQYQMTFSILAAENKAYSVGIVGYKVCAGRLIDPWIVPPCMQIGRLLSAEPLFHLEKRLKLTSWSVLRKSINMKSFPGFRPSWNHWRRSVRWIDAGSDLGVG